MRRGLGTALVCVAVAAGLPSRARAQAEPSAPAEPEIELYTMGQGDEIVERFGHAAMCVRWADPRHDRCYNYGTTRFEEMGHMVWGFLRGRAEFWVSTTTPGNLMATYVAIDRTVWLQRLPFDPAQARRVALMLAHDALPANRFYKYHHYDDNCTTRLRDVIDAVTDGKLSREAAGSYPTLRELSRRGFADMPAMLLVSDFVLGRKVDVAPSPHRAMFLPEVLRDEVAAVFGIAPEVLYTRHGHGFVSEPVATAQWLLLVAFALAAPLALARWRRRFVGAARAWAVIPVALIGAALWGIAIVSTVPEIRWNELVLVFMPLDLVLLAVPRWRRPYARGRLVELALVSLLRAVGVLKQPLWLMILLPLPSLLEGQARASKSSITDGN